MKQINFHFRLFGWYFWWRHSELEPCALHCEICKIDHNSAVGLYRMEHMLRLKCLIDMCAGTLYVSICIRVNKIDHWESLRHGLGECVKNITYKWNIFGFWLCVCCGSAVCLSIFIFLYFIRCVCTLIDGDYFEARFSLTLRSACAVLSLCWCKYFVFRLVTFCSEDRARQLTCCCCVRWCSRCRRHRCCKSFFLNRYYLKENMSN